MLPWLVIGSVVAIAAGQKRVGRYVVLEAGRLYRWDIEMRLTKWWALALDSVKLELGPDPHATFDLFVDPDSICERYARMLLMRPGGARDVRVWHELDASGERRFLIRYTRRQTDTIGVLPGERSRAWYHQPLQVISVEPVAE